MSAQQDNQTNSNIVNQNPSQVSGNAIASQIQDNITKLQDLKQQEEKQQIEQIKKQKEETQKLNQQRLSNRPSFFNERLDDFGSEQYTTGAAGFDPSALVDSSTDDSTLTSNLTSSATTGKTKEIKDQLISKNSPETGPLVENKTEFEIPAEVEKYMEKVDNVEDLTIPDPVDNEQYKEILEAATKIPKQKIILPLVQDEMEKGLRKKIVNSIRWLALWCHRNILLAPQRVFFKKQEI
ncbi:hypothetical protein GYA19_01990 [Candidatus Beckwithbacteria bacterium]|nr:hypothetical protein [Candidatus Beckwithbacteria bacterium]